MQPLDISPDLVIQRMQDAVDHVHDSEHAQNKIASCLFDPLNDDIYAVHTNHRPAGLKNIFSPDIHIGDSSQFVHSEVACILSAKQAIEGHALCITDPCCPNCAKAISESGIRHVYIDHKGLDKDFAKRRGSDFESLSLLILEKAGIHVSIVYRKEGRIDPLLKPTIETRTGSSPGIEFFDITAPIPMADILHSFRQRQAHTAWATARIREQNGDINGILVFEGLPQGLTPHDYAEKRNLQDKYRLPVDPLNRLYFYLKRKGLTLADTEIGSNLFPSSRAFIHSIAMNVRTITIGENTPDHDPNSHDAATLLKNNSILEINYL